MADASPGSTARQPDDHAVVVGIDICPKLAKPLNGACNDADDFVAWLIDPLGGGLDRANVHQLRSGNPQPNPPIPGNDEIDREFEKLIDLAPARGGRVGRRLYLFLAGHGFAVNTRADGRLLAATGGPRATGFHVHGERYAEWFQKAQYFDEVVLIMDCCRENYLTAPTRDPPWDPVVGQRPQPTTYTYAFATRAFGVAREHPFQLNGQAFYRGIFTHALLTVLRGSKVALKSSQLRDLTKAQMTAFYTETGATDTSAPRQEADFDCHDELVFGADGGAGAVLPSVRFVPSARALNQTIVLRAGAADRRVVHQQNCVGEFSVPLESGLYSADGSGWSTLFAVHSGEGQTVAL